MCIIDLDYDELLGNFSQHMEPLRRPTFIEASETLWDTFREDVKLLFPKGMEATKTNSSFGRSYLHNLACL